MSPLFVWIGAVGVADLAAALAGRPARAQTTVAGVAATLVGAACCWAGGYAHSHLTVPAVGLICGALSAFWTYAQHWAHRTPRLADHRSMWWQARLGRHRAAIVLIAFATVTFMFAASTPLWPPRSPTGAQQWLQALPYGPAAAMSSDRLEAIVAVVVLLTRTANLLVRMQLAAVSVDVGTENSVDTQLTGGRVIGPIERVLIFVLAVSSEPTAAALVISAKGLLRYPQLQRNNDAPHHDIAQMSEYLLVGSLTSWALALLAVYPLPT